MNLPATAASTGGDHATAPTPIATSEYARYLRLSPKDVSLPVELDQTTKRSEKTSQATTQSRPAPRRRTLRVSMEPVVAAASSSSMSSPVGAGAARQTLPEAAELKLWQKTLESVLKQCQHVLELMCEDDLIIAMPEEAAEAADQEEEEGQDGGGLAAGDGCDEEGAQPPPPSDADYKTDELCDLLKLRVESPEFPKKLDNIQKSMYQHGAVDETISWDIISAADIWDDESMNISE